MGLEFEDDITTMFFQEVADDMLVTGLGEMTVVQDYRTRSKERVFYSYGDVFRSFGNVSDDIVKVISIYPPDIVERIMEDIGYVKITKEKVLKKLTDQSVNSLDVEVEKNFLWLKPKGRIVEH